MLKHDTGNKVESDQSLAVLTPLVLIAFLKTTGSVRLSVITDTLSHVEQLKAGQLTWWGRLPPDLAVRKMALGDRAVWRGTSMWFKAGIRFCLTKTGFLCYPYASPPLQDAMTGCSDLPCKSLGVC